MAYILRDGVAIYYEVRGNGPVILLTHGFAATGQMWEPQVELLARDLKVVRWDLRGHGRSDSPDEPSTYGQEQALGDMSAILDAVGAQKAIVGGHSLGGFLSLAFNATHPDRVAALVLSGCGPGFRKEGPREGWNKIANGLADEIELEGLEWLRGRGVEGDPSDHKSVAGLVNAGRRMLTQSDGMVIESLDAISVPTFISVGAKDTNYLGGTEYLEAKIKGARRYVIEGAGHAANVERPEAFNAALETFLDDNSPAFTALNQAPAGSADTQAAAVLS